MEVGKMSAMKTQNITDGVYAVKDGFCNLFLIRSGDRYIAVDAGDDADNVRRELDKLQIDPKKVAAVLLTHTDSDHIAALGLFTNASIYISKAEEQMINGQTYRALFFNNKFDYRYNTLGDNQVIELTGLRVRGILTPGHTPGSMCYLINDTYLFVGDSLSLKSGKVDVMNTFFNMDNEAQRASLRKLAALRDVKYIFTAHYGFTDHYQDAFDAWKN
jgi:glyoxylase-like metal-dependent hydrolase (beta-lactamase superfamily II)